MNEQNFFRNYAQLIMAADYCGAENLIVPALVIIFTAIDTVSWLASDEQNHSVGERFQVWVNNWMLQKYILPCTAEELYAARCAVLHTLTPDSDLSKKKGVRRICYAWGKAKQKDLEKSIELLEYPGLIAVHVDDILMSFRNGFADYLKTVDTDSKSKELFYQKASKQFINMDISTISEFLASATKSEG